LFHRYSHWEWSLFRTIESIVESKIKSPVRLKNGREWVEARDSRQPNSIDEPDAIVDWLDDKGVISEVCAVTFVLYQTDGDQQWQVILALMEEAKNVDAKRAGEVD
jgi:hypothetical protein